MLQLGVIELVETGQAAVPGKVRVTVTCTTCGASTTTDVRADMADLRYIANDVAKYLCTERGHDHYKYA